MTFEGVTFNVAVVREMTRDEFIRVHLPVVWQDRNIEDRRKMLGDVWNLIAG